MKEFTIYEIQMPSPSGEWVPVGKFSSESEARTWAQVAADKFSVSLRIAPVTYGITEKCTEDAMQVMSALGIKIEETTKP